MMPEYSIRFYRIRDQDLARFLSDKVIKIIFEGDHTNGLASILTDRARLFGFSIRGFDLRIHH
jgi:hypothetical protein